MKEKVSTKLAPAPGGKYSQGIKVGNRVYVAGQTPLNIQTGNIADSFEDQTRQVFTNIQHVLQTAGSSMSDVVKVNVYLNDINDFDSFNSVYNEYFSEPLPVRTTVGSKLKGINIEIDVIAELTEM